MSISRNNDLLIIILAKQQTTNKIVGEYGTAPLLNIRFCDITYLRFWGLFWNKASFVGSVLQ